MEVITACSGNYKNTEYTMGKNLDFFFFMLQHVVHVVVIMVLERAQKLVVAF